MDVYLSVMYGLCDQLGEDIAEDSRECSIEWIFGRRRVENSISPLQMELAPKGHCTAL